MTPDRAAELVARWVRLYTRGLPAAIRERRVAEIAADVHDQTAHERARAIGDRRIALAILSRMVRGLAADASWRSQQARARTARASTTEQATKTGRTARRGLLRIALAAAALLSLPLVAMQLTDEVAWGPADFAAAGALVVGAGLLHQAAARQARGLAYRAAVAVALAAAFLLVWASLAVGVIGEPDELANLMYAGVLAVGALGAVAARFRAEGMARALLASALAQALVAAIALVAGEHDAAGSSVAEVLALNGLFAALFAGSALLFRRAAREHPRAGARPQA